MSLKYTTLLCPSPSLGTKYLHLDCCNNTLNGALTYNSNTISLIIHTTIRIDFLKLEVWSCHISVWKLSVVSQAHGIEVQKFLILLTKPSETFLPFHMLPSLFTGPAHRTQLRHREHFPSASRTLHVLSAPTLHGRHAAPMLVSTAALPTYNTVVKHRFVSFIFSFLSLKEMDGTHAHCILFTLYP